MPRSECGGAKDVVGMSRLPLTASFNLGRREGGAGVQSLGGKLCTAAGRSSLQREGLDGEHQGCSLGPGEED